MSAAALIFILMALLLFGLGHLLSTLSRRAAPAHVNDKRGNKMQSLSQAAHAAFEAAKRERMPIARVAQNAPDGPQSWFAQSIASVVPVYRADGGATYEKLSRKNEIRAELPSLYIRKRDYQSYVRWARTMQ